MDAAIAQTRQVADGTSGEAMTKPRLDEGENVAVGVIADAGLPNNNEDVGKAEMIVHALPKGADVVAIEPGLPADATPLVGDKSDSRTPGSTAAQAPTHVMGHETTSPTRTKNSSLQPGSALSAHDLSQSVVVSFNQPPADPSSCNSLPSDHTAPTRDTAAQDVNKQS
jgi:hypothetical protein